MHHESVAFIGGGNMTRAIVGGMLESDYAASNISIAEPASKQRQTLSNSLPGVFITADNGEAVSRAGCVVLSVKPQIVAIVCRELAAIVKKRRPLIISIAAGARIDDIDEWLGGGNAIARVMPNQPALLRKGISGVCANDATTAAQLRTVQAIMSAVGPVVVVAGEHDIDAVTAVSGSGPAYFYLLIDMIAKTGIDLGLEDGVARQLAIETALGAATLASDSDESMELLIARVRSPGGTTAAALDHLEAHGVRAIFSKALTAARDRATVLADQAHESGKEL